MQVAAARKIVVVGTGGTIAGSSAVQGANVGYTAGQIGVDAGEDMFSLAGPGVEQMIDAMRDPLSETTIKALPAHGIYAQALR